MDFEYVKAYASQQALFTSWQRLGFQCEALGSVIQNPIDAVRPEGIAEWMDQVKRFRDDLAEVSRETLKLLKEKPVGRQTERSEVYNPKLHDQDDLPF
jgi:hypothetical protein